jgi:hypothetical protein
MAEWPELDELKQVLDITSEEWDGDDDDTRVTRLLASAIAQTKMDIGNWDEDDDPTDAQAQGALRLAELLAQRPGIPVTSLTQDATYKACLKGSRRSFGVA